MKKLGQIVFFLTIFFLSAAGVFASISKDLFPQTINDGSSSLPLAKIETADKMGISGITGGYMALYKEGSYVVGVAIFETNNAGKARELAFEWLDESKRNLPVDKSFFDKMKWSSPIEKKIKGVKTMGIYYYTWASNEPTFYHTGKSSYPTLTGALISGAVDKYIVGVLASNFGSGYEHLMEDNAKELAEISELVFGDFVDKVEGAPSTGGSQSGEATGKRKQIVAPSIKEKIDEFLANFKRDKEPKRQCGGDSDCAGYVCDRCEVEQRICVKGKCVDCASDIHCVSGNRCLAGVCRPDKRKKKEEVCGNGSCNPYKGENCKNCPDDCKLARFCCEPEMKFISPANYFNKIKAIRDNQGGFIPEGSMALSKDINENNLYDKVKRNPKICENGKLVKGSCLTSEQCPEGVCVDRICKIIKRDNWGVVSDRQAAVAIRDEQTSFKRAYVTTYEDVKDKSTTSSSEAGLDVNLTVLGSTVGKEIEVSMGDKVVVMLEIENISDSDIALTAMIDYPQVKLDNFKLTEKEYSATYGWLYKGMYFNWSSLIGSFKSKLIGGRYLVMPKAAKLYFYSTIVPDQIGQLKVIADIYYTSEKRFHKIKLDQKKYERLIPWGEYDVFEVTSEKESSVEAYEDAFDHIDLENTINVAEKECWFFGCF